MQINNNAMVENPFANSNGAMHRVDETKRRKVSLLLQPITSEDSSTYLKINIFIDWGTK